MEQMNEARVFELAKRACSKHGVSVVARACDTSRKALLLYIIKGQRPARLEQYAVIFDRLANRIPAIPLHIDEDDGTRSYDCGLWIDRRVIEVGGYTSMGKIFGVTASIVQSWIRHGVPIKYVPPIVSALGTPDAPIRVSNLGPIKALRSGSFETCGEIDRHISGVVSARRIIIGRF